MRAAAALAIVLATRSVLASSPWALPQTTVECNGGAPQMFASVSSASALWSSQDNAPDLVLYTPPRRAGTGCSKTSFAKAPPTNVPWAAVVLRGGACNFATKVSVAQGAGAAAVLVVNNIDALYNGTTGSLLNPCAINCDVAQGADEAACASGAPMCAANTLHNTTRWCAVEDKLIDMYLGSSPSALPAVFVSIADGEVLLRLAAAQAVCRVFARPLAAVDSSVIVLLLIGCSAVALASYRAARDDRLRSRGLLAPHAEALLMAGEEHFDLSARHVAGFLCTTTMALLVLFAIVQFAPFMVVLCIQVAFVFGAAGAMSLLVFHAVVRLVTGEAWSDAAFNLGSFGAVSRGELLAFAVSLSVTVTWFVWRHSSWSWVLLDALALAMATLFLVTVRVPSLRVATALLCSFFVYDVFMVFVTPLLSGGRSVMVDVATAGKGSERPVNEQCVRQVTERMPMLFQVPRSDWLGGYSMLGLGDVVLPGMLVTFALRVDYAESAVGQRSVLRMYWTAIVAAYAAGLALTFAANINQWTFNGVKGQPALMYLVPFTLGTFLLQSWWRGGLARAWTGDVLEIARVHDSDAEHGPQ